MTTDAKYMFYGRDKKFSRAEEKAFAREELIFNVTQDILVAMEDLDVSKAELAKRLSKSKAHVSQLLAGARNMTLGSLSDICFVLGIKPTVAVVAPGFSRDEPGCAWQYDSEVHISRVMQRGKQHQLISRSPADAGWKKESAVA